MRAFVGLEFDENLKSKLKYIQENIKQYSKKGNWIHEDNFHMTLKFLGEINNEYVNNIESIIENVSCKYSPVKLNLNKLGYFNNKNGELRVLWLGISGEVEKLTQIYNYIDEELSKLGIDKEKREFNPHITLGRRVILNKPFYEVNNLLEENLEYNFVLKNISLFKSKKIMKKRVYTPIKSNSFKKTTV